MLLATTSVRASASSELEVVTVPPATCTTLAAVATMLSAVLINRPASTIVAPGPTDTKSPNALYSEGSRSMTAPAPVLV